MVSAFNRPPTDYGYYFIMIPLGFMGETMPQVLNQRFSINQLMLGQHCITRHQCCACFSDAGGGHPLALFVPVAIAVFGNGITLPNAQAAAINNFLNTPVARQA